MGVVIEGLELARNPDRLYPILPSPWHDFYAGRTSEGQQLVAGEWCPDVLVALFNEAGDLQEVHARTITEKGEAEQRLREWYGYAPGQVRVKRFRIEPGPHQPSNRLQLALVGEAGFAIAPFPLYWKECYADPAHFPVDDPDYVETVRRWIEEGNFVLMWGNEIQLGGSGEVVGT